MPKYKLTYFDIKARAEPIRILFAYAGVDYEDCRVSWIDKEKDWIPLKKSGKCPFGQIPILEFEGTTLAQAKTILRYLAREFGLGPSDSVQLAKVEMIMDKVLELEDAFIDIILESDPTRKEQLKKKIHEQFLVQSLGYLEKLAAANKPSTWFVGDKISQADIDFFAFMNSFLAGGKLELPSQLQGYSRLISIYNGVMYEPKILNWLEKRPQSM